MSRRGCLRTGALGSLAAMMTLALPVAAQAVTLGSLAPTAPSGTGECNSSGEFFVDTSSAAPSYTVPTGGGAVARWSFATFGATPGMSVTMIVLRQSGGAFQVVGSDSETLPNPLPAGNVATFTIPSPIVVQPGDLIGLDSATSSTAACFYSSGSASDTISAGLAPSLSPGATLTSAATAPSLRVNVSAEILQSQDAGVSATTAPSSITTGGVGIYKVNVTNAGPLAGPITLIDTVPAGVNIIAASGSCSTAGNVVTCSIAEGAGQSSEIDIAVSAPTPGSFTNSATVIAPEDPNSANNSASATLTVNAPPAPAAPACKVIALAGAQLSLAKLVIPALNCTLGKITTEHSKKIHKGLVIKTTPKAGTTNPNGTKVNIVISSGPPKKTKPKKSTKKH
jgi:uncharacterized repeat protein (TIGR01451 family)